MRGVVCVIAPNLKVRVELADRNSGEFEGQGGNCLPVKAGNLKGKGGVVQP